MKALREDHALNAHLNNAKAKLRHEFHERVLDHVNNKKTAASVEKFVEMFNEQDKDERRGLVLNTNKLLKNTTATQADLIFPPNLH